MDDKTWLGALAEAKVAAALIEQGFEVFTSTTGKAPFDLIAVKEGRLLRVEAKGTAGTKQYRGAFMVRLGSVRSNRTRNASRPLDGANSDVVGIYIHRLDKISF
jgi:Holliday junction resolvase-like predicted endonuclease